MSLEVQPLTLAEAHAFVARVHRHHKPAAGGKFAIGVNDGEKVVGVCVVGRPVARRFDNGWTAEVTRLATDGTRNACSILYAAAWRACRAMDSRLTLCATNSRINALPEKVASRLRDGRAQIVETAGSDQRPYQAW